MKFAVNYSQPAEELRSAAPQSFDLFKIPAWDKTVDQVSTRHPCYIHFPFGVGTGDGRVYDFDEKSDVDWERLEWLMKQTNTPLVNVHLAPQLRDHPQLDQRDISPATARQVTEWLIRDVSVATRQLGAEMVIAENDSGGYDVLDAALLPEVISNVIAETGCGFLLDLSHARIVARHFGMDAHEYISQLPTHRLHELHITGMQIFDQEWMNKLVSKGMLETRFSLKVGTLMDHLPITDEDWLEIEWAAGQIKSGIWHEPWVASCEYGGIGGGFFEATTERDVIFEQFPRLNGILKRKYQS